MKQMKEYFDDVARVLLAIALTLGGVLLATSNITGMFILSAPLAVIGFAIGMSMMAGE